MPGIGRGPISKVTMVGPRQGILELSLPRIAYRFKYDFIFHELRFEKASKLLESRNMIYPNLKNAMGKIFGAKEGTTISFGTPFIFIQINEERPRLKKAAEERCIKAFNSIFPGDKYFVDGHVVVDSETVIGNASRLESGKFSDPTSKLPYHIEISNSQVGDGMKVVDSIIKDSIIEGAVIGGEDAAEREGEFYSSFVRSMVLNSFLSGRSNFDTVQALNSYLELSQQTAAPIEGGYFEFAVLPLGRTPEIWEIIGQMNEEIDLAARIIKNPPEFSILFNNLMSPNQFIDPGYSPLPREGRITSLATALLLVASSDEFFAQEYNPRMNSATAEELRSKMGLISKFISTKQNDQQAGKVEA
jgi:hypothetical protein